MKAAFSNLLVLGISFLSFNSRSQSTPFLTNGLVAYYSFNGNANAVSGYGTNGSSSNVTFTADRFGNPNAAASFAGNSISHIQINSTNLNLTTDFTVAAWINYAGAAGTDNPRVFSTAGYEIGTQNAASSGRQVFFDNTTASAGAPTVNSANGIPAGQWAHIVGVRSGNLLILYVNGDFAASVATTEPPDYSRNFIPAIGCNSGALGNDDYAGLIDDIAIYNRALSPQEISEFYLSFASGIITLPTITIAGSSNLTYSIQYINNLSSSNWTTLASNIVLQTGPFLYPDTNALNQPRRFYRVLAQ